ncbi:MAG: hypothetical protein ACF8SC_01900 [Phycisphaerales bacterium JB037]
MREHGEITARADEAAARLRAIQSELAGEEASLREEQLTHEVTRAMSGMTPDERSAFLDELNKRFPSWDQAVAAPVVASGGGGGARSERDAAELDDPSFLAQRLAQVAGRLSEGDRRIIRDTLAEAGLVPKSSGEVPSESSEELRRLLFGADSGPVDAARCVELLAAYADFALSLDKLVWRTWQQMAKSSRLRRKGSLTSKSAAYAAGDREVSRNEIKDELELLRRLTAGLVTSVSQTGHLCYARMNHLLPESVMDFVHGEGKKGEKAYWRKFESLASSLEPHSFESEVLKALAEYVERVVPS